MSKTNIFGILLIFNGFFLEFEVETSLVQQWNCRLERSLDPVLVPHALIYFSKYARDHLTDEVMWFGFI